MKAVKLLFVAVVWSVSLLGVALWAQGGRGASATSTPQAPVLGPNDPVGPVLTGENIGLQRLAGPPDKEGRVPVRWMVKVNGEWHEAMPGGPRIVR